MSFQITVLKVLAGHPEGRASLAELRRAVAILISSGTDWTNRTKRLAARAPGLDIFSQAFVLRDDAGWQITEAGRAFLASVETPIPTTAVAEQASEAIVTVTPIPAPPPIRPVAVTRRRPRRLAAHPCDRPPSLSGDGPRKAAEAVGGGGANRQEWHARAPGSCFLRARDGDEGTTPCGYCATLLPASRFRRRSGYDLGKGQIFYE